MQAPAGLEIVSKDGIRGTKELRFYFCLECLTLCDLQSALGLKCCSTDGVVLSTNQILLNMLGSSKVLLAWILNMLCKH
jgi:hypothetical protein